MPTSEFLDVIPKEKMSRICNFIYQNFSSRIGMITNELQRHLPSLEFLERELQLPLLWGTIRCYSYIADGEEGLSPLMNLLSALEDLLMIETGKTFAYCRLLYFLCRSDIFWYNELALGKLLRRLYWDLAPLVLIILVNVQLST